MFNLVVIAVLLLGLGGFWVAHNAQERAVGAAKVEAAYHQQQAEQAKENERIAQEGKAAAFRLAAAADTRRVAAERKAASAVLDRQVASDLRAKDDISYALERERLVHPFTVSRLRDALGLTTPAESSGSKLPAGTGLRPATGVSLITRPTDQSWVRQLRSRLGSANQDGVGRDGGK